MAFVNEYISKEDMEKYKIRSVWAKFDRIKSDEERDLLMGKYSWTVDKDRDVFFIPVERGREEYSNEITCAFVWEGSLVAVTIANLFSAMDPSSMTAERKWDLLGIEKPTNFSLADEVIITVLKEALRAYQYDGVRTPVLSCHVSFNF
jgi:hypothetical protein